MQYRGPFCAAASEGGRDGVHFATLYVVSECCTTQALLLRAISLVLIRGNSRPQSAGSAPLHEPTSRRGAKHGGKHERRGMRDMICRHACCFVRGARHRHRRPSPTGRCKPPGRLLCTRHGWSGNARACCGPRHTALRSRPRPRARFRVRRAAPWPAPSRRNHGLRRDACTDRRTEPPSHLPHPISNHPSVPFLPPHNQL